MSNSRGFIMEVVNFDGDCRNFVGRIKRKLSCQKNVRLFFYLLPFLNIATYCFFHISQKMLLV